MLLSIQAPVFALTKGPAQVVYQTPSGTQVVSSNNMLPNLPSYTLNFVYRDIAFEQESGDDAALVYIYDPNNVTDLQTVWIAIQISSSITSEHLGNMLDQFSACDRRNAHCKPIRPKGYSTSS
jgi:hypothetical protein